MRIQLLSLALACVLLLGGAGLAERGAPETDWASRITLDPDGDTAREAVEVRLFVDGDTTHFVTAGGRIVKGRYLAVNTPESTGKIEPWGKAASAFTRRKLEGASEIVIESDTDAWNIDSTGTRTLVWVWYREGDGPWRNLNVELLQNGLAIANSSAQNRYGETCMAAIAQAKEWKLGVYSGEKDPDFYYGDAVELTLRELRTHLTEYEGVKVAFQGIVTVNYNCTVYVEAFDEETGRYFGIPVYYGYNLSGGGLEILKRGNEVRVVGTLQYYEAGDSWQISGVGYRMMKPNDPGNLRKLSEGHAPAWTVTDADTLLNGTVTLDGPDGPEEFDCALLAQGTTVTLEGVRIQTGYVSGGGDMTLFCTQKGTPVQLWTLPLKDAEGNPLTLADLKGLEVTAKGVVGRFDGETQIEILTSDGLTVR